MSYKRFVSVNYTLMLRSFAYIVFYAVGISVGYAADNKPNVVLLVADDLGYSDLGIYGSEIPTPNIDALARSGALLTNFYANATCAPSRSMLLMRAPSYLSLRVFAVSERVRRNGARRKSR